MVVATFLCDQCVELGAHRPADYALLAEAEAIAGPAFGDHDSRPLAFLKWHLLCERHHAELPEDARTAYVPVSRDFVTF